MTNTRGKRRGTRYMFARPFRKHGEWNHISKIWSAAFLQNGSIFQQSCFFFTGPIPLSTYMRIYKKGDIVDIKVGKVMCVSRLVKMIFFFPVWKMINMKWMEAWMKSLIAHKILNILYYSERERNLQLSSSKVMIQLEDCPDPDTCWILLFLLTGHRNRSERHAS